MLSKLEQNKSIVLSFLFLLCLAQCRKLPRIGKIGTIPAEGAESSKYDA
jgi:hypothetical protein